MPKRPLARQASRFVLTGILATAAHAVTVILLVSALTPPPSQVTANACAFLFANIFSYVLNSLWSFSTPLRGKSYAKFLTVSCIGFLGTLLVAYIAELRGLTPVMGIILVVSIMTPISFLLHRSWSFRGAVG
jgi:putative flippase GtrA